MQIRFLAALTVCWCAITACVYYREISAVALVVYAPVRAAITILLAAEAAGHCITSLSGWKASNWREAVPFQLSIGLAVISYASLVLAVANA